MGKHSKPEPEDDTPAEEFVAFSDGQPVREGLSHLPKEYRELYRSKAKRRTGAPGPIEPPVLRGPKGMGPYGEGYHDSTALMWGSLPEEKDMDKDRTRDVTDKVKERGGIPDPPKDEAPDWFKDLVPGLQAFFSEAIDAAIVEAARRFKEDRTPPTDPQSPSADERDVVKDAQGRRFRFELTPDYTKPSSQWGYGMPKEPPAAPQSDELGDALADLFFAGKKVLKAFVNEVLE